MKIISFVQTGSGGAMPVIEVKKECCPICEYDEAPIRIVTGWSYHHCKPPVDMSYVRNERMCDMCIHDYMNHKDLILDGELYVCDDEDHEYTQYSFQLEFQI